MSEIERVSTSSLTSWFFQTDYAEIGRYCQIAALEERHRILRHPVSLATASSVSHTGSRFAEVLLRPAAVPI